MEFKTLINGKEYSFDSEEPFDISLPIIPNQANINCFYAEEPVEETIVVGSFVGSVKDGGACNYKRLSLTPHGNGTHTECYGHISAEGLTINQTLKRQLILAKVLSVPLETIEGGDRVITENGIKKAFEGCGQAEGARAIVVRSLPNPASKQKLRHSGNNPPYFTEDACRWINQSGFLHLLTDLPSVDREQDGGMLAGHKAFWGFPGFVRADATITELVYVPENIADGDYLLNLQIISLESDASPSKPVIYKLR